ncbi:MAG: GNAT family N-acetyltransferase [Phycisphaerae bacterium]
MSHPPHAPLTLIAPNPQIHKDELYDLVCRTFENYNSFMTLVRGGYIEDSHYDWSASRIGLCKDEKGGGAGGRGDKIVTHFGIWDHQIRIGSALLRIGGVGAVATHSDYRHRGYMEQTAQASIEAMHQLGYDFSILFGINNFYHRFGYTRAWSDATYFLPLTELPAPADKQARKLTLIPFPEPMRPDLNKLFNAHNAGLTGTAVRPTYHHANVRGERRGYQWNRRGTKNTAEGYIVVMVQSPRLRVIETVGATADICQAIRQVARELNCPDLSFDHLPYDSDLARQLRRGNCRQEISYAKNGNALIRTINLPQALTKMSRELARRLARSPLAQWRGQLLIADPRASALLNITPGQIKVTPHTTRKIPTKHTLRGGDAIAQLLLGTSDPRETAATYNLQITGDAQPLLAFLFPDQHPTLHEIDKY